MSTFCIAECGSCHDGSIEKAKRLIDVAADAGADAAKFQYWSSADALADRRKVPAYYREIYRRYQMPVEWLPILKAHCDERGIEFMATTYLVQDIAVVEPFVKRFKISSFEATDREFLKSHEPFNREVIVSVGMMSDDELEDVMGDPYYDLEYRLLLCVSAYPSPISSLRLERLENFSLHGFSDHTACVHTGGIAVAAGAKILETHIRLNDTDPENPDYKTALSPVAYEYYVRFVRHVEMMMGEGQQPVEDVEAPMRQYRVTA